jgi:hypothetical protein
MWDSVYTMPESSYIAMALLRHKVLDIKKQNGMADQRIKLSKPMALLACKEIFGKMNEKLVALEVLQDLGNSE